MQIDIRTNFPDTARWLGAVQKGIADQALARALNRTVEGARTDMSREIRAEFNLPAGYVRKRLTVRRASASRAGLVLVASLAGGDGKKRAANVIAFGARQVAQGVSVKIKRSSARKVIKGAFIGNKGRTVFIRTSKRRLPITAVQTIDVPQMFNTRRIQQAVVRAIDRKFPVNLQRDLMFYLKRAGL